MCGLLLYLGAKALGVSVPEFLLQALTQSGGYLTGLIGALVPASIGCLVASYVTGFLNSRNERKNIVGMRILALVMTMVFFLFIDIYVATFDVAHHGDEFRLLLPNLTFSARKGDPTKRPKSSLAAGLPIFALIGSARPAH